MAGQSAAASGHSVRVAGAGHRPAVRDLRRAGRGRGRSEAAGRAGRGRGRDDPRGQPDEWRRASPHLYRARRQFHQLRAPGRGARRDAGRGRGGEIRAAERGGAVDGAGRSAQTRHRRDRVRRHHFEHRQRGRLCRSDPAGRRDLLCARPPSAGRDGGRLRRRFRRIQRQSADRDDRPAARRDHAGSRAADRCRLPRTGDRELVFHGRKHVPHHRDRQPRLDLHRRAAAGEIRRVQGRSRHPRRRNDEAARRV